MIISDILFKWKRADQLRGADVLPTLDLSFHFWVENIDTDGTFAHFNHVSLGFQGDGKQANGSIAINSDWVLVTLLTFLLVTSWCAGSRDACDAGWLCNWARIDGPHIMEVSVNTVYSTLHRWLVLGLW